MIPIFVFGFEDEEGEGELVTKGEEDDDMALCDMCCSAINLMAIRFLMALFRNVDISSSDMYLLDS